MKDINSNVFEPKFTPHFRVKDNAGKTQVRRAAHLKLMDPVDKVVAQTPAEETFQKLWRASKLQLPKSCIPDLKLKLPPVEKTDENSSDAEETWNNPENPKTSRNTGSSQGEAEQCTEVAESCEVNDQVMWREIQQNRVPHQKHHEIPTRSVEKTVETEPSGNRDEIPTRSEKESSTVDLIQKLDEILSCSSKDEATKHKQVSKYKGKGEGTKEEGNHRSFWDKVASFSAIIMRGNNDHAESKENTNANATQWVTEINLM